MGDEIFRVVKTVKIFQGVKTIGKNPRGGS